MFVVRDGDVYAALRDCYTALHLDINHMKAHFRLARCLYELSWTTEALDCLLLFKAKFPDNASSKTCEALEKDIRAAIFSKNSGKSMLCAFGVISQCSTLRLRYSCDFILSHFR